MRQTAKHNEQFAAISKLQSVGAHFVIEDAAMADDAVEEWMATGDES